MTFKAPDKVGQQSTTSIWLERFHFLLFMLMGSGANWVLATALTQEVPYLEENQPEGLCIATYMNATNNFGLIAMSLYLFVHNNIRPIPYQYSVPSLLVVSSLGCFISAAVYPITAGNISIMLYFCCGIGGCVGALSSVVMNPFMTAYKNDNISAARSGGSAYILICALLSVVQSPGSSNQRFSVSVYMTIFGILLIAPVFAYRYITKNQIGLRSDNPHTSVDSLSCSSNPLTGTGDDMLRVDSNSGGSSDDRPIAIFEIEQTTVTPPVYRGLHLLDGFMIKITAVLVPASMHQRHPWLRATVPYMATVGWVNFNTWGVVVAMMPFAIANSSSGSGSQNLAIAYQLGAVLLVSGDLSTTLFRMPMLFGAAVFSAFCFTIYLAALNLDGFHTAAAPGILITIFAVERFIEAHLVTTAYRAIATEFPLEHRQPASRAVGVADQVSTAFGAILSTLVVSLLFSCSAGSR